MKLNFKRSGGFGNLTTSVNLDTATMKESAATKLNELVGNVKPFVKLVDSIPDGFTYDLVVEDGDKKQEFHAQDGQVSPELQNLIDFVLEQA